MNKTEWLNALDVGSEVAVSGSWHSSIDHIDRVTKSQLILKNGQRFKRVNGYLVGGSAWSSLSINPVTDEIREKLERDNLLYRIGKFDMKKISTPKLKIILATLKEGE